MPLGRQIDALFNARRNAFLATHSREQDAIFLWNVYAEATFYFGRVCFSRHMLPFRNKAFLHTK